MKWSEEVWAEIGPVYAQILELPFITELINGTLSRDRFMFYIRQDALYLADYGKVLTGIATKLNKTDHIEAFISFAGDSVEVERSLHGSFDSELKSLNQIQMSPSCTLYTSYLMKQLAVAPVEVVAAAVLPCFWIYKEVGDYILANQTSGENPYQGWIDTYGGDDFAISVRRAIMICDDLARGATRAQRQAMTQAFVMCSKMEWMFWDSAYRMERWSV